MSGYRFLRYWFCVGQYDAYHGRWDCPPISASCAAGTAYEAGQRAAATGHYMRQATHACVASIGPYDYSKLLEA